MALLQLYQLNLKGHLGIILLPLSTHVIIVSVCKRVIMRFPVCLDVILTIFVSSWTQNGGVEGCIDNLVYHDCDILLISKNNKTFFFCNVSNIMHSFLKYPEKYHCCLVYRSTPYLNKTTVQFTSSA